MKKLRLTKGIIFALLFLTPLIFSSRFLTYSVIKSAVAQILILVAFLTWGKFRVKVPRPLIAFFIAMVLSLIFGRQGQLGEGLLAFYQWLSWGLLYIIIINTFDTDDVKKAVIMMVASTSIVVLYGLLQATGFEFTCLGRNRSPVSTIGNVNYVAQLLIIMIPIACITWKQCAPLTIVIMMGVHLMLTKCRGGWVGLAVAFFFIGWMWRRKINKWVLVGLLVAASVFACTSSEVKSMLSLERQNNLFRLYTWQSTVEVIKDYPIFGVGIGKFKIAFPKYRSVMEKKISGIAMKVDQPHNDYLQIAAETGLVGLGCFIWLLVSAFPKKIPDTLTMGLTASLIAVLVHAFFSFPLQNPVSSLYFWSILGFLGIKQEK